jgi:hypothetical protein
MRTYTWALQAHKEEKGDYPDELSAAIPFLSTRLQAGHVDEKDFWGHSVYYLSDRNRFLLVSYGRDGLPDQEYTAANQDLGPKPAHYCESVDADQVFTALGEQRVCGK